MLSEAIKTIGHLAKNAAGPQQLPAAGPHEERRLVNGEPYVVTKDYPPRNHTVHDIESLAFFVEGFAEVVIWHDDSGVVAVLNDPTYRDSRVTMRLPLHPTFVALAEMEGDKFDQRELIEYLRLNLRQEIDRDVPTFLAALREIRFVNNAAGDANIQHGRESMGKRIEQSVTGVDALPEDFQLQVPLWLHLDAVVSVECALVTNIAEGKFRCGPKPGAIEQAKAAGQKWLDGEL